jgi:acyl-CoA synthetase (AMP-forming)/AMP-acid ligase II
MSAVAPPLVVRVLRLAASDPGRPAIVDGVGWTWISRGELAACSAAVAAGLAARGIGRGDRVAVAMPNLVWWPMVALGVWRAGAVLVPVSGLWTAAEARRLLAGVRPRLAIASAASAPVVRAALPEAEVVADGPAEGATRLERLLVDGGDPFAGPQVGAGELALILFSGGTGGLPKAVRWTHARLAAEGALVARGFGLGPDSVALASAPFFHALGLFVSLCGPLSAGARIVTLAIPDTGRLLEVAAAQRVTHVALRPPAVAEIAADADRARHDTARLELVVTGGAHVPAAVQLEAGERLGCSVRQLYGSTETGLVSGPLGGPSDPETAGWLAGDVQARLVDPDSGRDVAPGNPGELCVRGPRVTDGYDGDPEATAAAFTPDGWLRTGDLVAIREDGQLVIHDRLKELIKVGGASVAPAELELVLREHPAVREAVVVGRPHPQHGEVPVAHVVVVGAATPDQLLAFVGERVADHKRLHEVRIVAGLPRSATGKLLRRALRDHERAAAARASGTRGDA